MVDHFAVTVGLPVAAIAALLMVILLKASSGDISFKFIGFEFSGASGEIVLWVLCFMSIVTAIRLLWPLKK